MSDQLSSPLSIETLSICDLTGPGLRIIDALLQASTDLIMVNDRSGRLRYVGKTAAQTLRNTPEALLGQTFADMGLPAQFESDRQQTLTSGQPVSGEIAVETAQETRDFTYTFSPVADGDGPPCATLCIGKDVTERNRTAEQLRRKETRYRGLAEELCPLLRITDSGNRVIETTPSWQEFTGQSAEQALGPGWQEAIHPDERATYAEARREAVARQMSFELHYRLRRHDGAYRKMTEHNIPVPDHTGRIVEWVSSTNDVTDLQEVQTQRQRLAAIVESSDDAIISKDFDGIVTSWNRAAEQIFGYTAEEMIGKPKTILFPPDRLDEEAEILQRLRAGIRMDHFETVRIRKDGTLIAVQVSISPIRDVSGAIVGASTTIHDITPQQRVEEAEARRVATEAMLSTILDNAPAAVYMKDRAGKYLFINRQAETLIGAGREQVIGNTDLELVPQGKTLQTLAGDQERRAFEAPDLSEQTLLLEDGPHTCVCLRFPLADASGAVYAVCGILTDITDRKILEQQLLQSQKMEGIGRLAGGIAHDFNNLLTAIIGYAELAEMETATASPVLPYLQTIQQAAQRAAALTQQLLAFARKQISKPQVINLNALIIDADRLLRRIIGEDIELITIPQPDLGLVKADPNQCTQVLINLAVNARDAMPDGGKLTIETANVFLDAAYARNHAEVTPGEYILMAVADTGTGIPPEIRSRLFEPFFTTKEPGKGTGLGLATCYGIIKQSGGHIWVYSEPGRGSIFKVYLPRVNAEAEMPGDRTPLAPMPAGTETIMVVEDEPLVRSLAVEMLRAQGYRVLEAGNGEEALRVAQEYADEIHLLVTDVVMPRMGGKALAQRLQTLRPTLKVLYVSGYTDNSIVHHGVLDADVMFLQKPYMSAGLAHKIREALDGPAT